MFSRREVLIPLVALAVAASPAVAQTQTQTQAQTQAQTQTQAEDPAVARIKAFYDSVQAAASGSDPKQRLATLSEAMMRTFDIGAMARLAVGPQWKNIPAAKQASLQDAFGRYFVATYAKNLGQASGGRFEVLPDTTKRANGQLVRTRVIDQEGKTTPVDYIVNADGKVADIYLGGSVSLIAARRSEFDAALKAGGADALEANLRKRAAELTGGS